MAAQCDLVCNFSGQDVQRTHSGPEWSIHFSSSWSHSQTNREFRRQPSLWPSWVCDSCETHGHNSYTSGSEWALVARMMDRTSCHVAPFSLGYYLPHPLIFCQLTFWTDLMIFWREAPMFQKPFWIKLKLSCLGESILQQLWLLMNYFF